MNSNTSGADVANVGFWPRGLIQRIRDQIALALSQISSVVSGEATLATVDFIKQAASDYIPDDKMAEIVRRLVVTIETRNQGAIVLQVDEPTDRTKVWWKLDPTTNLPVGVPLIWNDAEQRWTSITEQQTPLAAEKKRRTVSKYVAAGSSTVNVDFLDIGTTDYHVNITPTTFYNGVWNLNPTVLPDKFAWMVTNRNSNQTTVVFYVMPAGGLTFDFEIIERE